MGLSGPAEVQSLVGGIARWSASDRQDHLVEHRAKSHFELVVTVDIEHEAYTACFSLLELGRQSPCLAGQFFIRFILIRWNPSRICGTLSTATLSAANRPLRMELCHEFKARVSSTISR